jgi:NAD(P)-dependent dehydrogenase (short-subunit alcohol dehydrogenase family)
VARLFSLKDKVALLTDAGGTGSREIALLLADAGAHVVVADRELAAAQVIATEIVAAGGSAVALHADVENEASVIALFDDVTQAAGRLDIVVNIAGMSGRRLLEETTVEQWDALHSINSRAVFLSMREAVKRMRAFGRGGRIINVTTIGTLHPVRRGNATYGASRIGVTALSRDVALDHVHEGILVNMVCAGGIVGKVPEHPLMPSQVEVNPGPHDPILGQARMPLGAGHMNDVASAVLYLASPAGRYMTGQSLVLDGGFLLT